MKRKSLVALSVIVAWAGLAALGGSPELVNRALAGFRENLSLAAFYSQPPFEIQDSTFQKSPEVTNQTGRFSQSSEKLSGQTAPAEIPETVLWAVIFSFPEKLQKAIEKARENGQDDSLWMNYFIRQAGLSDRDNQILNELSFGYSNNIRSIKERTEQIIREIRGNRLDRDGAKPDSASRLERTNELLELQKREDEATLQYRDILKSELGDNNFSRFEKWVLEEFSKGFTATVVTGNHNTFENDTRPNLPKKNGLLPLNNAPSREIELEGGEN